MIKLMYPELLKRLDDAQDDIRIYTCRYAFISFFNNIQKWQESVLELCQKYPDMNTVNDSSVESGYKEIRLDSIHWETMVKSLCIHLDDMNTQVQVIFIYLKMYFKNEIGCLL